MSMMNWCLLRSHLFNHKQLTQTATQISVRTMAVKSHGTGKKRFRLPTNTQAEYLVNNVSGSNIFKDGQDLEIKGDDQYPDWIWTMNLGRPKKSDQLEYGTTKYWEALALESNTRLKRFMSVRHKTTKRVGLVERRKMEWQERIKYRALAAFHYEPGYRPEDVDQHEPNMKIWLRPPESEELLYPDQFARERKAFFRMDRSPTEKLDLPLRRSIRERRKGFHDPRAGVVIQDKSDEDLKVQAEPTVKQQQLK